MLGNRIVVVPDAAASRLGLRDATDADIETIQSIYSIHVSTGTGTFEETPPDVAEMRGRWQAIVDRQLPYLVAGCEGSVQGFAYAAPFRPRSAYRHTIEDSIYVHPDAIGRGLGRTLLAALIDRCATLGYRQMVAVIGDSANTRSICLHGSLGFVRAGTLCSAGFKFDRWLDVVFMQRSLGDGDTRLPAK